MHQTLNHKFYISPQAYDDYSALYTEDSHTTLQIPHSKI